MKLKTVTQNKGIVLMDYSEEECRRIFGERDGYVLRLERYCGEDYGGSQCSEERETSYETIIPERVLVKDGHFYGVEILTEYDFYNGGRGDSYGETVLRPDKVQNCAVCGYSFSNDDHSRWNKTNIYLQERE